MPIIYSVNRFKWLSVILATLLVMLGLPTAVPANKVYACEPPPDYIVISPDSVTITAGENQTYTAEAFDAGNESLGDVTGGTTFEIVEAGHGGSWTSNEYTSVNAGTWTVRGTYYGKTDDAELIVKERPLELGSSEEEEETRYFTVDFLGKITRVPLAITGRIMNPLEAESPDGTHLFEMQKFNRTVDGDDKLVTLIEIREAEAPELPKNIRVVGSAYDFRPSGINFDKSVELTLGYDVNDLPEDVESVALAYYTADSGWIELETKSGGVIAEFGKLTSSLNHFTVFAVLAEVSPRTPMPTPPEPTPPELTSPAAFKMDNLSITPSLTEFYQGLTFIIRTGKEATVTVEVTNYGGQEGSHTVVLSMNGIQQATREVSLSPNQNEKVTFNVVAKERGSYVVTIGDLSGEFASVLWINWWLIIGLSAAFALVCWLAWNFRNKLGM